MTLPSALCSPRAKPPPPPLLPNQSSRRPRRRLSPSPSDATFIVRFRLMNCLFCSPSLHVDLRGGGRASPLRPLPPLPPNAAIVTKPRDGALVNSPSMRNALTDGLSPACWFCLWRFLYHRCPRSRDCFHSTCALHLPVRSPPIFSDEPVRISSLIL